MPGVNPLNSRNVDEVLRRDRALRRETSGRDIGYDEESRSRPKRKSQLIRRLAKFIAGRRE
jgi:hypothetical protein